MAKFFSIVSVIVGFALVVVLHLIAAKAMHISSETSYSSVRDMAGITWFMITAIDTLFAALALIVVMGDHGASDRTVIGRFKKACDESKAIAFCITVVTVATLWSASVCIIKGIEAVLY